MLAEAQADDIISEAPKPQADESGQWQVTSGEMQWVASENNTDDKKEKEKEEEEEELDFNKGTHTHLFLSLYTHVEIIRCSHYKYNVCVFVCVC